MMPQCFDQRYKNRQRRRFRISKRHNEKNKVNVNASMRECEKREARNESQDGSAVISCLAGDQTFFAYSSRSSVFPSLAGSVTNCANSSCSLGGCCSSGCIACFCSPIYSMEFLETFSWVVPALHLQNN